jgi:hypothetical protein
MPARAYRPRDYALVENAVRIVYSRIYAKIRGTDYHSLEALNTAIRMSLEEHNGAFLHGRNYSRRQQFEEIEKAVLMPLPALKYELKKYMYATVAKNGHAGLRDLFGGNYHRAGHKNQFGGFFKFGYIFRKLINFETKSQNNFGAVNSFEGLYIKPSFISGAYSFNQFKDDSTTVTVRTHHRFGALLANFGNQWVFDSRIVLEIYFGAGAEIDNAKGGDDLYGHRLFGLLLKIILLSILHLPPVFVLVFF